MAAVALGVAASACGAPVGGATPPTASRTPSPTAPTAPTAADVVRAAGGYLTAARSAEIQIAHVHSGSVHRIIGDLAGTRTKRVVAERRGGISQRITLGSTSYVNGDVAFWRGRGERAAVANRLSREYLEISPDKAALNMSLKGQVDRAFGNGPVATRLRAGVVTPAPRGGGGLMRLVAAGRKGTHTLEVAGDGSFRPVSLTTDAGSDAEERWRFVAVDVAIDGIAAPPPASVYRPKEKG